MATQGLQSSQEPSLELTMGYDHLGGNARCFGPCPALHSGGESLGACFVTVEDDEEAIATLFLAKSKPHSAAQRRFLDELGAMFPDGTAKIESKGTCL